MIYLLDQILVRFEGIIHGWLVRHSIAALRITMGAIFFGFGILKYFHGLSPAASLVEITIHRMSFGLVPGQAGLLITATLECFIGLSLLSGIWLRLTLYLLVVELLGILSPLALAPGLMFNAHTHAPTLAGQYVMKDVLLVAATMVIATKFLGARILRPDNSLTVGQVEKSPAA